MGLDGAGGNSDAGGGLDTGPGSDTGTPTDGGRSDVGGGDDGGGTPDTGVAGDAGIGGDVDVGGACAPFVSPPECMSGLTCLPSATTRGTGTCVVAGTVGEGLTCTGSGGGSDCAPGLACGGSGCLRLCDHLASPGTDGDTCATDQACIQARDGAGAPLAFGVCLAACLYDEGTPCTDSALSCVPRELVGLNADLCLATPNLAPGTLCGSVGLADGDLCGATSLCADFGDGIPVCVELCRGAVGAIGAAAHPDCSDAAATCLPAGSAEIGVCDPGTLEAGPGDPCVPFVASSGCRSDLWCAPSLADASSGTCQSPGGDPEGAACTLGSCQAGLQCLNTADGPRCLTLCDPDASAGAAGDTCGGDLCLTIGDGTGGALDIGACVLAECVVFGVPDGCQPGEWCVPAIGSSTAVECAPAGAITAGGACGVGLLCAAGTLCVGGICRALCDTEAAPAGAGDTCGVGEGCFGIATNGPSDTYGVCQPACTPFSEPPDATCDTAGGEWCVPDLGDLSIGQCTDEGAVAPGGACDGQSPATSCSADHLCIGSTCTEVCDPAAAAATPGSCSGANDVCLELGLADGTQLALGWCAPGCDYDTLGAGGDCADGSQTCVFAELMSTPGDLCLDGITSLDEGDDCSLAGIDEFRLCGGNSVCLTAGANVVCREICRTSEGAFSTTAHPDCTRAGATCTRLSASIDDFGVCI